MELIVALLIASGVGGTLSIPYLKYRQYRKRIENISVKNDLGIMEVPIDKLFTVCSDSFDTHRWSFRYLESQVSVIASGYKPTRNRLIYKSRVILIEDTLLVVSFDDFIKFCEWNDKWVKDGLLATWHKRYKESKNDI